jgi:two-component system, LytTR family, response regulator
MKIRAYLLDDEEYSRLNLKNLLLNYCATDVEIIGDSDSPIIARKEIEQQAVDVLFLDIEMPKMTGFEFLATFQKINFQVVFVTAYQEYAIQAIKQGVLDYILKPISIEDLRNAVQKIKNSIKHLSNNKLLLYHEGMYRLIPKAQILYLEGSENYTKIICEQQQQYLISKTLKEYEYLVQENFYRIHKSYIINLQQLNAYSKTDGGTVTLNDGTILPISRRKQKEFNDLMLNM